MTDTADNLPMIPESDGFDDRENDSGRVIRGAQLKYNDGCWSSRDGQPAPSSPLLVVGVLTILQQWLDQKPIKTLKKEKGKPWPDVEALNDTVPQSQWEIGIDGKPRAPWQMQWVVYLLDEKTAERFTYANGTVGARIAVDELKDRVSDKRFMLANNTVLPLVELPCTPMKTRFGGKMRPEFKTVGWRSFGGTLEPPPPTKLLSDEIPF